MLIASNGVNQYINNVYEKDFFRMGHVDEPQQPGTKAVDAG
jgi:hypothetical protein